MSIYTCDVCHKNFPSLLALSGHKRMHGKSNGLLPPIPRCCCIITRREVAVPKLIQLQSSLRYCKSCNLLLTNKYQRKFCNHSCAASFNNKIRTTNGYVITKEHKAKISKSLKTPKTCNKAKIVGAYTKIYYISCITCNISYISTSRRQKCKLCSPICLPRLKGKDICGAYSKLYYSKCKHCTKLSCLRHTRKYCVDCSPLYDETYRQRFKFTFNVYKYPDLFDIQHITNVGWYSRGGTAGNWNPDGLSRDHKVSVSDAIKNGFDPYYISHPMNCEIMTWLDNNKKKSRSSILYEDLVKLVDNYESTNYKTT